MPIQLFELEQHASSYAQGRPSPPRALVDAIIQFLQLKCPTNDNNNGLWSQAVDVGAGSGQTTFIIKDYFHHTLGIDISVAQIDEANKRNIYPNVAFKVASAEKIPVAGESVSLITASQCLHWFDLEAFYHEVDRVLVPGGVFATFGYLTSPKVSANCVELTELIAKIIDDLREMDCWEQPATDFLNSKYSGLKLPFDETQKIDSIISKVTYSGQKYLDYICSFSAYNELAARDPEKAKTLIKNIINQMKMILGTQDVLTAQIELEIEFFLIMSRKPV